jgi:glutamyl-tRNA synthetase
MNIDEVTLNKEIRIAALENALKFKGKCNQGAIIGKLFSLDPSLKSEMKTLAPLIGKIVSEINSKSLEEQKDELLKLKPNFEDELAEKKKHNKESRSDLPELRGAEMGKVVTRMAPEPSKYNHIGHAVSFLINYMYAKKYEGKCILRFDDTNPEKETQEYVDAMKSDVLDYLDIKADKVVFASDSNDEYIKIADKLVDSNNAYVCHCEQSTMSLFRREMKECSCRNESVDYHKNIWNSMKNNDIPKDKNGNEIGYVLRLRIDMSHKNAVMRDPVIFRIVDKPHYRQGTKYKVWPMYDFECALIEGELGVTHVMRSNEFESRIELQNYIREVCGYSNHPIIKQYARFNVTGATTKGREIKELIDSGEFIGWDDPRLVTLRALKRRGIVKEAYYELAKVIGMSKTNSNLNFEVIAAINRKLLDASAKRFFFIENPVKIIVNNAPSKNLELEYHPEHNYGKRSFNLSNNYLIEKSDFERISQGEIIRLIDNINIRSNNEKDKTNFDFVSENYEDYRKEKGKQIIHFLPGVDDANINKEIVNVEILMPDNTIKNGLAEHNISKLNIGEVVQFQRFGFCRFDSFDKKNRIYKFWYTHE